MLKLPKQIGAPQCGYVLVVDATNGTGRKRQKQVEGIRNADMIIERQAVLRLRRRVLAWRNEQIVGIKDVAIMLKVANLGISDDGLGALIDLNKLRLKKERGTNLTNLSPRPIQMTPTPSAPHRN
jgi:hypothetical protein